METLLLLTAPFLPTDAGMIPRVVAAMPAIPGAEAASLSGDSSVQFARVYWLYAAAGLGGLVWWLFVHFDRLREKALARLVHPRFRQKLVPGFSPRLRRVKRGLWVLAVLLLCVAAAGPRKGYEWREVKRRGIDILFAVDTSRSMLAEDLSPNRLERARMGIHDFVARLEGDRVGLIPFAGSSFALCPLTLDYDAFGESLDALDTDLIPRQGTDVASAIREAERLFEQQGNNQRILVLITDGEDLQGDAVEAAKEAAKKGMVIYPVGVGSTEGTSIPITTENGRKDVVRDDSGNPVTTKLDEKTLKETADATGGLYVALGRGAEGLDTIYREKLRLVPKNELASKMEKVPLERFEWPLGAALLLLIMEFLLPDRRRETKARTLPSAARRHPASSAPVAVLAAGLILGFSSELSRAEEEARVLYNEGTAEYDAGEFAKAAEKLKSALNTPDLKLQNRAYYNLGNSHYRLGQASQTESPEATIKAWEVSIKAYGDALALDSSDEDARFNQELVKRKLEALKKQQEQKKDDQKKDDQNKDGKKKDDEKKNQNKKDGEKNEQEQKDGQDQQSKDGEKSDGDAPESPEQNKDGKKEGEPGDSDPKESDEPTGKNKAEGDKKEGEQKQPGEDGDQNKSGEQPSAEKQPGDKDGKQESAKEQADEPKGPGKDKAAQAGKPGEEGKEQKEESSAIAEERRTPGEMTPSEARQLLQALRGDERTVIPLEKPVRQRRFRDPNNTTKGKTW